MEIFLIIVAIGLVATYAYVKVRERREDGDGGLAEDVEPAGGRGSATVIDDGPTVEELFEDEAIVEDGADVEESLLDEHETASSSWLEEIAVEDDDALADLEAGIAEPAAASEVDELDATTVDEEFETLTADLEVEVDEHGEPLAVKEDVASADDIMANSRATEINPAGNTELQMLLQKVQARLSQYE